MSNERSSSKSSIEKLVRFFEKNIYQLKSPTFNETQARQQLIDPFFGVPGWDVHNRKMNPVYLQEVIPEGRVKTNVGKDVKEQEVLFEKTGTLGKANKEYASILRPTSCRIVSEASPGAGAAPNSRCFFAAFSLHFH